MGNSYKKEINNIQNDLKEVFKALIKNNEIIVDVIQDCSKKNIKDKKKALSDDEIIALIEKIDTTISNYLALKDKDTDKDNIKQFAKYLKVNSDVLKVSKNTITIVSKLNSSCKYIEDKNIKKNVLKIYQDMIKIFNILVNMLELNDEEEIADFYDDIVILDSKIDSIYEEIQKYIIKKSDKKDDYSDIMIIIRKTEKISSRAVSIASLIKFGY
ncbi:MAG: hypothetical protein U9Q30_07130 [Campylobacterota bacterium]|nr:hypothetical protein [Campylobacterota bacterium]